MNSSLIITCHNQHIYLNQLLELLQEFEQQLAGTEIIVIDSSDTELILSHPVQYYHVSNRGPSAARNFGAAKATGEWLVFCDADDFIHPYVFSAVEKLNRNINAHAYFFKFKRLFNEDIEETAKSKYGEFKMPASLSAEPIVNAGFFLKNFFPVHAIVLKRSVFDEVKFNEDQWFIEDVRFYLEMSLTAGVSTYYCKDENLCSYHRDFRNKQSLSTSNDLQYWESVCSNYNFFAEHSVLKLKDKLLLSKLAILNYHIVADEIKVRIASENKIIWNFFLGFPKLFRAPFFYKLLFVPKRVIRFVLMR